MYRSLLIAGYVSGLVLIGSSSFCSADTLSAPLQVTQASSAPVNSTRDQQAAHSVPLSPARERTLQPKDNFAECSDCPELVVVPAGSFMMGSSNNEAFVFMVGAPNIGQGRSSDESLQHEVTIAKPFAVGRFAVTFDEWDACVADGGCSKPADQGWGRAQRPVINVSWNDIQSYLKWLSRKTGGTYRLLSEAEFEYVARAGSKTAYPWGAEIGKGNANCDGCGSQWGNSQTSPVGPLVENAFGLYDLAENPCGRDSSIRRPPCNVWEWVEDCDHGNHNGHGDYDGAPTDGSAWTNLGCRGRVVRGGVWYYYPQFLRSSYRSTFTPDYRNYFLGFRVARTLTR
jgi:formylglycine-generating enzyme required for sulfatase activity